MTGRPGTSTAHGFTLVEVLIGVVVLGLGLLGLAAIFPAVVVQQRAASEAIEGPSLVNGVRSYIGTSLQFTANSVTTVSHPASAGGNNSPLPPGALRAIRQVNTNNGQRFAFGADGLWVTPQAAGSGNDYALEFDERGNLSVFARFRVPAQNPTPQVLFDYPAVEYRVAMLDRLIPSIASVPRETAAELAGAGEAEPRFVWDMMVRRIMTSLDATGVLVPSDGDDLQIAVFIRRIDTGLRRPPGGTLVDALRPANNAEPEVVPVAADNDGGRALLNGRGEYSRILTADLEPSQSAELERQPQWVVPAGAAFDGLRQVGQKLVTGEGRVLTVSRVVTEGGQTLLEFEGNPLPTAGVTDPVPVWYTPQVPVAVDVFRPQLP